MRVGSGSIVLNQDPSNPMAGTILARGPAFTSSASYFLDKSEAEVAWNNGKTEIEQLSDLTLTAALVLERE